MRPRPNAKEIYVASLLLFVGSLLLAVQAASYFSPSTATIDDDRISISRSELLSDIRTFITLIAVFTGAIGLLKLKKIGWIFSLAMLLVFLLWTYAGWKYIIETPELLALILVPLGTVVLLLGILFLLLPSTRERFQLNTKQILVSFAIGLVMILMHFFLQ